VKSLKLWIKRDAPCWITGRGLRYVGVVEARDGEMVQVRLTCEVDRKTQGSDTMLVGQNEVVRRAAKDECEHCLFKAQKAAEKA
jgi:hypothetical protein